ncbi:hypothetical protein L6164_026468 [Bauhinia variegata]|uniref:Uncharacterized protein n=1 Tax=Bauhinia variegata TaxID=167791 RepID=A0ACB9LRQ3_BAUVA|nr:hypothetical protein L6164_026468 [Bauhinia variegata]
MPADMVVNAIIVAMVANASKCSNNIYHVGSSMRNPIKYMNIADYGYKYFTEMPWMDKNRKPVKVGTFTILDMPSFKRYIFIHYLLPLKGFKLLNKICCQHFQKRYLEFNRKIQAAMRLVDLYGPYLSFNGVFDDRNMEKVEMAAKTIDSFAIAYCKRKLLCFPGDIKTVIDVMPPDMVVNAIIVSMAANVNQCYNNIYHVGSSLSNPIRYLNIRDYGCKYFKETPWMDKNGEPVKVGTFTMLDMASFKRYIFIHYLLTLKGFKLLNTICCQHFLKRYLEFNGKIQVAMRLVDFYRRYLFFNGVFGDRNMETLERAAKQGGAEMDLFYFDPKMIDWEDYFTNVHFPGIVKYIFKVKQCIV